MADVSGIGVVATLATGIVAAFFAAYAKWRYDVNISKQKNALDLFKEFHSKEMLKARTDAYEYVKEHKNKTFENIHDLIGSYEQAEPLRNVLRFYHQLAICVDQNYVDRSTAFHLFGALFVWWHQFLLRAGLDDSAFHAKDTMRKLDEYFASVAAPSSEMVRVRADWLRLANIDANRIHLEKLPSSNAVADQASKPTKDQREGE